MLVAECLARETGRRQAGMIDIDCQFLAQFADQRLLRRFAGFQLAARELPQPGHRQALGTLLDQQSSVAIDERRRDDNEQAFWRFSGCKRGQIINLPV